MRITNRLLFLALAGVILSTPVVNAKNKKPKAPPSVPKDEIKVVGHIPLTNGPVTRFLTTQHYSSEYLYAERDSGKNVMLIDVTKANQPSVLADLSHASDSGPDNLAVVAGTAALVTSEPTATASTPTNQTVKIMDFSDPQNPQIAREFTGVTAMSRDDRRGVIFVANTDGIWILQEHFAEDPKVEKAYADYVLYGSR